MKIGNLEVYGIIYKLKNNINNKVYIGQTIVGFRNRYSRGGSDNVSLMYNYHLKNKEDGYYYNKHILSAMNKYGLESFEVNDCFDIAFSKEELDIKEDTWIRYYDSVNNGYNEKYGGANGKASEETRRLMSERRRGENNSMYGKKHSEETRRKLKINHWSRTKIYSPPSLKGELNPRYGAKHTEETKERIRKGNIGRIITDDMKKKISESNSGKNNGKAKSVVCLNTREIFDTVAEASLKYGIVDTNICGCCNNKATYSGTINGVRMVWAYYQDYINMSKEEIESRVNKPNYEMIEKKVVCLNNGMVFETIAKASEYYGIDRHGISNCCKGKRKSAGKINGEKAVWIKYIDYIREDLETA